MNVGSAQKKGEKSQVVTLMEEAGVGVLGGEEGKNKKRREGSFEKDAAGGRGYIFVVHI